MQIHSILKRTLFFLHLSLSFFFPFLPQPNHRNHDMLRLLANTDTTPTSSTKVIGENIGPLLPAYGVISSYRRISRFTYLYTRDTHVPNLAACFALNRVEFDERYMYYAIKSVLIPANRKLSFRARAETLAS